MLRQLLSKIYKLLSLTVKFFTAEHVMAKAAALTYSTLLAIVPILAVVFAIARGFGYNKYIEVWFRGALVSQPEAAEVIIGWVNSYLVHTKSGLFLGVGLVFMLYTVLMLVSNVEQTFNEIFQVRESRPMFRSFASYLAVFFLFPIIVVVTTGLSIFMATIADSASGVLMLSSVVRLLIDLSPYIIMSAVFIGLYIFMPNTRVDWRCAVVPGVVAGIAMQWLQLPLFMLWVQISWTICLFGAQLTYTNLRLKHYGINLEPTQMHPYVDMADEERDDAAIALYADALDEL